MYCTTQDPSAHCAAGEMEAAVRCRKDALLVVLAGAVLVLLLSVDAMAATKPSVRLETSSTTVTVGTPVTLSGAVTNPRPGATSVAVLEQAGTRWKAVGTTELSADGTFTVAVTPGKAGTWDLVAQYKAGRTKVRSSILAIDVQAAGAGWSVGAGGGSGVVALTSDHTVWAWGGNDVGQLGIGTPDEDAHATPSVVGTDTAWAAVSAGRDHTLALKTDGTLWAWGGDGEGQLAVGETTVTVSAPTQVGDNGDWAAVSAGRYYSLAVKRNGTLWAWGANGNGQLGVGDGARRTVPTQVGRDADWTLVSAGSTHAMALKRDGSLWGWGYNGNGQLGVGDTRQRLSPARVGDDRVWVAVSCGNSSTLAITNSGRLLAWGYNGNGQLGLGDTVQRLTPTEAGLGKDWAAVSCGDHHTLALKSDGSLWSFGWNGVGQLGVGDTEDRTAPAQVGTETDWVAVSGGHYISLAAKADGTLWTWGENDRGQLGVGDTDDRDTPTEVVTASP
jgi:alpha-tubulin suppressor-like RCC1 family protein